MNNSLLISYDSFGFTQFSFADWQGRAVNVVCPVLMYKYVGPPVSIILIWFSRAFSLFQIVFLRKETQEKAGLWVLENNGDQGMHRKQNIVHNVSVRAIVILLKMTCIIDAIARRTFSVSFMTFILSIKISQDCGFPVVKMWRNVETRGTLPKKCWE